MRIYLFILQTFRLLREHQPWKLVSIFLLTLLLGVTGGFSIVLLIPLLQLLNVGSEGPADQLALFFQNMAAKSGIGLTFESVIFGYVILLTLSAFLQYYKSVLDARYQQTFIYMLRRRLFRKIIMADWSRLNSKSKTNHLQVLTKEVPNLADYYYFYLRLLTTLLMTTTYVAFAMVVSVKFTLAIIFIGIILLVFLRKFLFKAFHLGEGIVRSYNQLLKYIDDFWQTVKIAKVHNSEEFYSRKFDEASTSLLDLEFRMQRNYSIPHLIFRISGILVLVLIVYLGYRIDQLPLTSFFTLILLFSRIYPQFTGINTDVNMIVSNVASVKLVLKLDEDFPDPDFHRLNVLPRISLDQEITLGNIRFGYADGEKLLENYTESIPAKKITGILGESGRGKTTLIDLIAGLQTPDQGEIRVDGRLLDESPLVYLFSSVISGMNMVSFLEIIQITYLVALYFIFRLIADSSFQIHVPRVFVASSLIAAVLGIGGWLLFSVFHIENPLVTARIYPYMGYTVQAKAFTYSSLVLSSVLATGICFQLAEIMVHKDQRTAKSWIILAVLLAGMMTTLSKTSVCLLAGLLTMGGATMIRKSAGKRQGVWIRLTFIIVIILSSVYITGTHFYISVNKSALVPQLVTEGFVTPRPVVSFNIGETQVELLPTSYYHLKKNAGIELYRSSGLGVGPGRFREELEGLRDEGLYPSTMATFPPHSTYSGALAENGLAGLLLIIIFYGLIGRIIWQNLRLSPSVFTMGMAGIFVTMFIEALAIDTMGFRHYWVLFGVAAALPVDRVAVK